MVRNVRNAAVINFTFGSVLHLPVCMCNPVCCSPVCMCNPVCCSPVCARGLQPRWSVTPPPPVIRADSVVFQHPFTMQCVFRAACGKLQFWGLRVSRNVRVCLRISLRGGGAHPAEVQGLSVHTETLTVEDVVGSLVSPGVRRTHSPTLTSTHTFCICLLKPLGLAAEAVWRGPWGPGFWRTLNRGKGIRTRAENR